MLLIITSSETGFLELLSTPMTSNDLEPQNRGF